MIETCLYISKMHVFYVSLNKKVLTTNIDCQKKSMVP